ncbi:MAG TPA: TVP38/TMEM64 family protein [Gemmatimonadaceae bacterium]|jgi:uncharacterized membrane protein YdjX (TVP38/TMEM64 family)|nr:TVP38/TMEM64 family protein [Gemmatimonadaceae bacterium]
MAHVSGAFSDPVGFESRKAPATRSALVRIGALALILIATSFVGYKLGWFDYRHTLAHVSRLRKSHSVAAFTIGFVLFYGIGSALGIPGLPLTVAAGLVFGTFLGVVLSWIGALIGAATGYWLARTIGHGVVSRWLQRNKRVDTAITESRDFPGVLRLRLIPVLPLGVVNFVGGLARAPFWSYLAATAVGVLPALVVYAYFADSFLEEMNQGGKAARLSLLIASLLIVGFSLIPKLLNRSRAGSSARN